MSDSGLTVVNRCCCGMDVHKDTVVVCVRKSESPVMEEIATFATTSREISAMGDWLLERGVTIAAMESTGVYWKPVWNLLEDRLALMLVNARHIKHVPGRKTDMKDCQWIARCLAAGMLSPSFVPERPQRELRDLTRNRAFVIQDRSRVSNRIQKILEDANIKLGSVASDVMGKSGRDMLEALISGKMTPGEMADLARMQLRQKIPQLKEALTGRLTDHHRFMLKSLLADYDHFSEQIQAFDDRIEQVMPPFAKAAQAKLIEIPGFAKRSAQNVLAEIGWDMSRFPSAAHMASWAGVCPGNNQSAGKRGSGRVTEGNKYLKRTLTQCAFAASRSKKSYYHQRHQRLTRRRGRKRANLAIGHSLLRVAYELLRTNSEYKDLGVDYYEKTNSQRLKQKMIKNLQQLGYNVTLTPKVA